MSAVQKTPPTIAPRSAAHAAPTSSQAPEGRSVGVEHADAGRSYDQMRRRLEVVEVRPGPRRGGLGMSAPDPLARAAYQTAILRSFPSASTR